MIARIVLLAAAAWLAGPAPGMAAGRYDYCGVLAAGVRLLVVDRSDAHDAIDKEVLAAGVERIMAGLADGERLVIHTITDDPTTSRKVFDACAPACEAGGKAIDRCSLMLVRRDKVQFRNDLVRAVRPLIHEAEEHKGSAILATLASLVGQYRMSNLREVTVFSDLIENSKLGNFLAMSGKQLDSLYERLDRNGLVPRAPGATVAIFGFGQEHGGGGGLEPDVVNRIKSFWILYFTAMGAEDIRINQRLE